MSSCSICFLLLVGAASRWMQLRLVDAAAVGLIVLVCALPCYVLPAELDRLLWPLAKVRAPIRPTVRLTNIFLYYFAGAYLLPAECLWQERSRVSQICALTFVMH